MLLLLLLLLFWNRSIIVILGICLTICVILEDKVVTVMIASIVRLM